MEKGARVGGGDHFRLTFKLSLESPLCKKIFVPFSGDPLLGTEWPRQEGGPGYPSQFSVDSRGRESSAFRTPHPMWSLWQTLLVNQSIVALEQLCCALGSHYQLIKEKPICYPGRAGPDPACSAHP